MAAVFKKRAGTSGAAGQVFEQKLTMYCLLRATIAKESNKIDRFFLGSNLDCVSGYDDVVFKCYYTVDGEVKSKLFCVQSKHKDKPKENKKDKGAKVTWEKLFSDNLEGGDFNVKSYLNSYLENKIMFSGCGDRVLDDGCDCEFALFTNAKLDVGNDRLIDRVGDGDFLKFKNSKRIVLDPREDKSEFDVLKIPFQVSTLLKNMINVWVEKKRIYRLDDVYQMNREHLEKYVISIDQNAGEFRKEFLDGDPNVLPEEIVFLRKNFLCRLGTKLRMTENKLADDLKQLKIAVEKGHGKSVKYETKDKLFQEISTEQICEFFNSFTLLFDQPDEVELEGLIKDRMQVYYGLAEEDVDLVYNDVYSKIEKWWKHDGEQFYITEANDWFGRSRRCVESVRDRLRNTRLRYGGVDDLRNSIKHNSFVNIVCNESTEILLVAKVCQILDLMRLEYALLDVELALEIDDKVLEAFEDDYDLVVISQIRSKVSKKFLKQLYGILQDNSSKKLVLISDTEILSQYPITILNDFNVGFDDLEIEAQREILQSTAISFQGDIKRLDEVITPSLRYVIDHKTLADIASLKPIMIKKNKSHLDDLTTIYIPRKLESQRWVDREILNSSDKIALSGYDSDFSSLRRVFSGEYETCDFDGHDIFLLNDPEKDFELLATSHAVHWLKFDGYKLIWVKSNKHLQIVRAHLMHSKPAIFKEDDLGETEEKIVIVAAEAGMGKTTLLSNMMEKPNDQLFKYRINLLDHSKKLASHQKLDALEFLRETCLMEDFEYKLFEAYFKYEGNIVLYFDGFDEISPDYKEVVLKLFCDLAQSKVEKIYITTRLSVKEDLEERLNTFAYGLKPFSEKDQKTFLKSYWNKDDEFVTDILDKFSHEINDELKNFIGIPLQLKMLVDIYDETLFDKEMNLFKIYDRFFEKKYYDVQCTEKSKLDLDNLFVKKAIELDYKDAKLKLGKLAMIALYKNNLPGYFKTEIEHIQTALKHEIVEGKERSGVISCVVDGEPKFVHRTFAEFFAATWLVRAFQDNTSIGDFLLAINFFRAESAVMRRFFDLAMCEDSEMCRAVLRNDKTAIGRLNESEANDIRDKGGRSLLHLASAYNHDIIILILTQKGVDVSPTDNVFSYTPIAYADKLKHQFAMEWLLRNGAKSEEMLETIQLVRRGIDERNNFLRETLYRRYFEIFKVVLSVDPRLVNYNEIIGYMTPALMAANEGSLGALKYILSIKECDMSRTADSGTTPLHAAVNRNYLEMVKYLAENFKCFLNARTRRGETPLFQAVDEKKYEIIKILVESGADVNIGINEDCLEEYLTPLDIARNNNAIVRLLSSHGAIGGMDFRLSTRHITIDNQINIEDGDTGACLSMLRNAIRNKDLDAVVFVLCKNEKLARLTFNNNLTPLHLAASEGGERIVECLLKMGADPTAKDKYDNTPLHMAAYCGDLDAVRQLLDGGGDPTAKNKLGRTSFHCAVMGERCQDALLDVLSSNGTLIKETDALDKTPLHLASAKGRLEAVKYLMRHSADPSLYVSSMGLLPKGYNALRLAIDNGHLDVLKYILSQNIEHLGVQDELDNTLLHAAANIGMLDIIEYLIDQGLDPIVQNHFGETPLVCAIIEGHLDACRYLVSRRKEIIHVRNNIGVTPFNISALHASLAIVVYFLSQGCDPMTKDNFGNTVLHDAVQKKRHEVIVYLVSNYKQLIDVKNSRGDTPLQSAIEVGEMDIAAHLLKHGASI